MQQVHIPLTSLVMSPARNKVLESWGLLRVICGGGGRPLHIAKFALEGPRLHEPLNVSTQHLHQSMQSVMPLERLQSMQSVMPLDRLQRMHSMVSFRMC